MSNLPATIGGKYVVVRRLGKGGMGTVFEAVVDGTGERVAVKVIASDLADDPTLVTRFQREARTVATLDTPHVVKVYEAGVDELTQLPYMAMEYLEGEDLRQVLKRIGPLRADLALRIAVQACRALEAAHAAKILHRDIKPANLFLARQGDQRVVKLLDFGVAKTQHSELTGDAELTGLTRTGSMIGSPLYMSPEQARGYRNIDGRSDIWSLGVVMYQMLSGRTPHAKIDELGELLVRICTEPPPPLQRRAPWVPPYVADLVHCALRMQAEERFESATALLEAATELLPDGAAISEESLRPLSDVERGAIAESSGSHPSGAHLSESNARRRASSDMLNASGAQPTSGSLPAVFAQPGFSAPAVSDPPTSPSGILRPEQGATLTHGATTSSIAAETSQAAAAPDKKPWRIAALVAVTAAVAAGVYIGLARGPNPPEGDGAARPAAQETRSRTVKLVVLPKESKVEIDGAAADLEDGLVELTGTLGSVHKVRVTVGSDHRMVEVAITENGPSPAKIELALTQPAPQVGASAAASATASAASASATATAQPVAAGAGPYVPRPKPVVTAAPVATPTSRALRDDR